jgi:hypothetical protein
MQAKCVHWLGLREYNKWYSDPPMEALDQIDDTAEAIRADLDAAARYTADVRQKVGGLMGTIWQPTLGTDDDDIHY